MSLRDAPLLYVFYDIHGLDAQREILESVLELPVIEIEPHLPHERHGVVKYDAGGAILSLNLSTPGKFRADESDALVTVLGADPDHDVEARLAGRGRLKRRADGLLFTDPSGHHFLIEPGDRPAVRELRLTVDDLDRSVAFYRDVLDLEPLSADGGGARYGAGGVPLVLVEGDRAADGRRLQRRTVLIVFYTADVDTLVAVMRQRGLAFANRRAYFTDIGGSIRFEDPSGHRICLYQPSAECLTWGSGPKVLDLVTVP